MANQSLGIGGAADDGTGDNLRIAADKINDNFLEIYTLIGDASSLTSGISATATVVTLTAPTITGVVAGTQTSATITTLTGTTFNAGTLALAAGSITDSSGAISFGNENLTTTGTITGDVTGNADTATTLATARTIGGTSFNGSANIAVGLAATATALATARTIAGVSFNGTANITLASTDLTDVTATAVELNILDASAGNTAVASDVASSAGAVTSNNFKIKHTLTLAATLADDAEHADVVITSDKVLATSVVLANASIDVHVDVHTVVAGSFKVRITNKSGATLADDSTMILNYRIV